MAAKKKRVGKKRSTENPTGQQALVTALNHPVRVKALTILTERQASAKDISSAIDHPLSNVSYHMRVLRELGLIEAVGSEQIRGSVKTYYRALERPLLEVCDWEKFNPKVRSAISSYGISEIVKDAAKALETGSFDARTDRHLSRTPMVLDEQGWKDATAVQAEGLDRFMKIQAEAAERLNSSAAVTGFNVIAAMTIFEMPSEEQRPQK
jgi:DNA-binding transcriptional ArsR family regulator